MPSRSRRPVLRSAGGNLDAFYEAIGGDDVIGVTGRKGQGAGVCRPLATPIEKILNIVVVASSGSVLRRMITRGRSDSAGA